ncbi:Hypothetical protein NGAL_HAMBI1145_17160 [Neorhizobium galegae bv. officinalis]|uniref:Uncharacterized protein n=1 Tax=Neorhizobium galegae bv. officinalis TaxID=323656 RepID=A0A0T7FDV5_NEOGA|nr:hypothetical protein [Neorhizobium galegae]CDZ33207.1 Hypothetical protein NGAL_HAMBI1145_17160 [Neorhizobium galegae bv. officinalis]
MKLLTPSRTMSSSEREACERYAPILQSAAAAISEDLDRLSNSFAT